MKLSLIIPVHNKFKFLKRCFDSIAQQLNELVEVIVIDDSFREGEIGRYIRDKFKERSRFEI